MTLDARQQTLPVGTVLLRRVILVIESNLTVLVRLAVFRQRDFLRLDLALLFLHDNAEADKSEQHDKRDFHGRESYHMGMRKVGPE